MRDDNKLPHAIMPDGRIMQLSALDANVVRACVKRGEIDNACHLCDAYKVCTPSKPTPDLEGIIGIDCADYDTPDITAVWKEVEDELQQDNG